MKNQEILDFLVNLSIPVIGPVGDAEAPGPQHRIEAVFLKAGAGRQGMDMVDRHRRLQGPGCSEWMGRFDCRTGVQTVSMQRGRQF